LNTINKNAFGKYSLEKSWYGYAGLGNIFKTVKEYQAYGLRSSIKKICFRFNKENFPITFFINNLIDNKKLNIV